MLWSPPDNSPASILSFEVFNSLACFYALEHREANFVVPVAVPQPAAA